VQLAGSWGNCPASFAPAVNILYHLDSKVLHLGPTDYVHHYQTCSLCPFMVAMEWQETLYMFLSYTGRQCGPALGVCGVGGRTLSRIAGKSNIHLYSLAGLSLSKKDFL
jgi:hypothetical protein